MSELIVADPRKSYRRLYPLVVDCSVLAALLFHEEHMEQAADLIADKSLFAPWLIDHEMVSVGLKKAESGRADIASRGLDEFINLRVHRRATHSRVQWLLARQENLSAYDAAYLQLAIELHAPLATFDQTLGAAAARVLGG